MAPAPQGSTIPSDDSLPLAPGAIGAAVVDVQARLSALGHSLEGDPTGQYGAATECAVTAFQRQRGLRVDGICGHQTWNSLVEAGFRLGQRLLYHRAPMLRGDDVATLQRRLSALGFDTGRVDGIFGPQTAAAVTEFQRNTGLVVDSTCGRDTVAALERLGPRADTSPVAADLRERLQLGMQPKSLRDRVIAIGERGDLAALADELARRFRLHGAIPIVLHHLDESEQAAAANAAGADLYLGLMLVAQRAAVMTAYFHHSASGATSPAGRHLAALVHAAVVPIIGGQDLGALGMGLAILRETRMPAVVCEVGSTATVVEHLGALATALSSAVEGWVASPWME